MLLLAAFLLLVLGVSLRGSRTAASEPRWPFLVAAALSGGAFLALVMASVIVLTAGRYMWNSWANGSKSSETVTLWLLLIVGPLLLVTCCALLIIGSVLRTKRRGHSEQASSR